MMRIILLILFTTIVAFPFSGMAQSSNYMDSVRHVLSGEKDDTIKVWTLRDLGVFYLNHGQPDSAIWFGRSFGKLSDRLHFAAGMAISLSLQAAALSDQNKPDEAIQLDLKGIELLIGSDNKIGLANIYNNTAIVYYSKGDYAQSLDYYMKALTTFESLADTASMAFANSNIAEVYNGIKEYKRAYEYSLKGISLCRSHKLTKGLGPGLLNLSSALINLTRYDTALVALKDALAVAQKANDRAEEIDVFADMDYAYVGLGEYDLIKPNADKLMAVALSIDSKQGQFYALIGLKYYYLSKKNYSKAERASMEAINIAKRNDLTVQLRDAYQEAAGIETAKGDQMRSNFYNALRDSIDEVIFSDKILKNTQEIEAKYSLNKKQAEIDALNKEKKIQQLTLRQRTMTIWGLAALVLGIVLTGMLYYRNYQNRKRLLTASTLLQEKRISELEREKQLLATQAVLQGQVEERTRLAKDLHDGLGSILSSTKYSFTHMKEHLVISQENAADFERSMAMLDKSISELRRVSHNMMPEALMKFGLDTALKDFCNSVGQSGALPLTYQSYDLQEGTIPPIIAAAIYRIIQELVNNIIRHAQAKNALVQLVRKDDVLSIAVEDDGKGFDPSILANSEGMGWLNLKNRVAYLNGTIDIQSHPGSGTSVNIEILNFLP